MKKNNLKQGIAILFVMLFFFSVAMQSCSSQKSTCPAYKQDTRK